MVAHFEKPESRETSGGDAITDLSQIDFEQAEKIELSGNIIPEQYSNFQYFSTRTEFKDRLNALMGWASKADLSTIYGTITIDETLVDGKNLSLDSIEKVIAEFEDLFIRNIRVPRNFTPPVEHKKRASDNPDYKNVRGNFDLACRTPSSGDNPHMLEFVLYDCSYDDALKKVKTFEGFARGLGLSIEVGISPYIEQNTGAKKTKPMFSFLMPQRRSNRKRPNIGTPAFA